jgi:hypothetical protein
MPCRWFLFVRFAARLRWPAGAGSDWTADRLVVHPPPIPPIVFEAPVIPHYDLAPQQDAFQAVFPSISGGV